MMSNSEKKENVDEIDRRFGVHGPEAKSALDGYWAARFRDEPGLVSTFQKRVQEYSKWLREKQGTGGR